MKKLLTCFIILCLAVSAIAADGDNEFVAFSLKGKVQYKDKGADKAWKDVSAKTQFFKGNVIKLEKDAELVLVHRLHKTVKLAKAGEHKVDALSKDTEKKPADENATYWQYIWKEFNKQSKDAESYHRDYMQTKGGVDRGDGCVKPIMMTPVYDEKLFADSITFTWEKDASGATVYTVVFFKDEFEDLRLLELDVTGQSLTISTKTFWFKPGANYYWVAYPKGKPNCARFPFTIVKMDDAQAFIKKIDDEYNASKQTPADAVNAARKLEEAGYMQEAGIYFYQAVVLSELAVEYKLLYGAWLARAGRLEEAQKWWV
ncbi:MAG TPA: hypothetical protein VEC12_05105 [Bacteroidia bacterium]|nr:hypothetical protein [Bacteroidia bacterium]